MYSCLVSSRGIDIVEFAMEKDLIPSTPHQPKNFKFPKRSFGKKKTVQRSFQPTWFSQWSFLHYDEAKDVVLCHTCLRGFESKRIKAAKADSAFVSNLNN